MSSTKPTGGSAFPHPVPVGAWGDPSQGMLLRDYFAAKAMQGILSSTWTMSEIGYAMKDGKSIIENNAICAYEMADAMLAARAEVKP